MLSAAEVAKLLAEIGQRIELTDDAPFKARAYYKAAESLQALALPLEKIIAEGKLRGIPGVGEALAEKIIKLHQTGTHPTLEYLRQQIPASVLEMLHIPGLGPKKAAALHNTLKISTLAELEEACHSGRLQTCKGFGGRMPARILAGLAFIRKNSGQCLLPEADEQLRTACAALRQSRPEWQQATPAGPARRACELVDELCLVAQCSVPLAAVGLPVRNTPSTGSPTAASGTPCWHTLTWQNIAVHVSPPETYGLALLFATGSQAHLAALRAHAAAQGCRLDEKGLWRGARELPCRTEEEIYAALGLPFIEPELREGRGEVELAARQALPKLVRAGDLRGVLHCHTTFSDGAQPLAEMAQAARRLGCQYFGVADHSQAAAYAGGMRAETVRAQFRQADALNAAYSQKEFRIFKGVESDIGEEGSLDYPEALLKEFDFIIASIHSRFNLGRQAQTQRLVKAVANPRTTILGHPTGRLLLQREGYPVDLDEVLRACAKHGVVVELNAHPQRLDLDWRWHKRALELGCLLSINPDAHRDSEMSYLVLGVRVARKGGVPPERVLNCMSLPEITQFFAQRKGNF